MPGPLGRAVAQACAALLPQVGPACRAGVEQISGRLDIPLQLAVAGRIKSGKSTLVNAIIGRRVAPTAVGECTRLVTRFQYGTVDRIEIVHRDGGRTSLPFTPAGAIPDDPGMDLAEISHLEVFLTSALLSDITVIDTPGLGSLDELSVARTRDLLGAGHVDRDDSGGAREGAAEPDVLDPVSRGAVAGAEAVVYVFTQLARADDKDVLDSFRAATAGRDAGPINALAVLNKADTIAADSVGGAGGDVAVAAKLVAAEQARVLRPRVADVLPMMGLLAETTETGGFTAADAEALRALAGMDEAMFAAMVLSADLFLALDAPVDVAARTRLVQLLDLYGIELAVSAVRSEPGLSAGELRRRLVDASGLAELRKRLSEVFAARADGIKAGAALASLAALGRVVDPADRARIHDAIEGLLQRPETHQLRMLEVLTLLTTGAVQLPGELTEEVLALGGSGRPDVQLRSPGADLAALKQAALERAGWWRGFASFGSTPAQSRVAQVVHRTYFLLWQDLQRTG